MKRIDNRRILYDCQVLASDTNNNKFSSHWPKVLVAGTMQDNNKDSEMSYAQDSLPSFPNGLVLIDDL
ncbi:hypothetical protein [Paraglaciecola sp.]|uniref:hypothetical protein n=1 Tax=Paraglaciecola sp. TaxID=1920173 RepID=UPI0030F3D00C